MTVFSSRLLERYRELLPNSKDFDAFVNVSKTRGPKTIRTNTLKASDEWVMSRLNERNISFEKHSTIPHLFTLHNLSFLLGAMWETQMGFWQPQEMASQLPPLILDAKQGEQILDMAAAPGNKTIQLSSAMQNEGVLVACEPNKERAKALRFVLGKAGVFNAGVALQDALTLPHSLRFDKILLDAPCSGEGLLRKKPQTLKSWSEKYVQHKAQLQSKMVLKAADLLKEGGAMVYSVCTLSPEECEGVLTTLLHEKPMMKIVPANLPKGLSGRPGLSTFRNRTFSSGMENAIRLYPQDHNTQSFFIAKLVKEREKK